jgi:SRSO17 transposase
VGRGRDTPKKTKVPDEVQFKTKPQIALDQVDRAKANGIEVIAWNADELYGRDGQFLDGLDLRNEAYVVEIPPNAHAWLSKPKVLRKPPKNRTGRPRQYPRLRRREAKPSEAQNLAKYSPTFTDQTAQRYRIKDTHKGPDVWEIRWSTCWRKTHTKELVSHQCTLIVAKNVLTGEVKYLLSNRVPGRAGWNLRKILRVAFSRWPVEDLFREAKEELGLDHFECRLWQCIHRHLTLVILSHFFCARVREKYCVSENVLDGELLTTEQVRRATNMYLEVSDQPRRSRHLAYEQEIYRQTYYQLRNAQASKHHRKRRRKRLYVLGIDPDKIKSVDVKPRES